MPRLPTLLVLQVNGLVTGAAEAMTTQGRRPQLVRWTWQRDESTVSSTVNRQCASLWMEQLRFAAVHHKEAATRRIGGTGCSSSAPNWTMSA